MRTVNMASEGPDGLFVIRTQGLAKLGHAELEIVGLPREVVEAASKLIDFVIDTVVDGRKSELLANQRVGFPLAVHDRGDLGAVFVGVQALESVAPTRGFLGRLKDKGVLRLVDLFEPHMQTPRIAIASMMVYRANCRVALGEVPAALTELRAAIAFVPAVVSKQRAPALDADLDDAKINWQNHLAYLRLAALTDDAEERARVLRQAYGSYQWLALDALGASPDSIARQTREQLVNQARRIILRNIQESARQPGPHPGLCIVPSPIWSVTDSGAGRQASLIPAGFAEYWSRKTLPNSEAVGVVTELAVDAVLHHASAPWRLAEITRKVRELYLCDNAPYADHPGGSHPAHLLLSAAMAEAVRLLHSGATHDELRAQFDLPGAAPEALTSLAAKLDAVREWEMQQYTASMFAQ